MTKTGEEVTLDIDLDKDIPCTGFFGKCSTGDPVEVLVIMKCCGTHRPKCISCNEECRNWTRTGLMVHAIMRCSFCGNLSPCDNIIVRKI